MRAILTLSYLAIGVCRKENFKGNETASKSYKATWEDLDSRPLPQWYDSAKIGILVHWGVYSVPSFKGEWFWYYLQKEDPSVLEFMHNHGYFGTTYADFATMFIASAFIPDDLAEIFSQAGAKYVLLTAKHHDGFALFPQSQPTKKLWDSLHVGPKKDIVKHFSKAMRKYKMKFGVYYALSEWFNSLYTADKNRNFVTTEYPDKVIWPDIKLLVNKYKPYVLWADGGGSANDTYWKSKELLAWLYNKSLLKDKIVVNDRWGKGTSCRHGDFYNCKDRFNPRHLMPHKWENALSLDKYSRGFRRNMLSSDVLSFETLIENVVSTVSCGGNILMNVGLTGDGALPGIFEDRLSELGDWLQVHGEAIYGTSPWFHQRDSHNNDVWYTCKKKEYDGSKPLATPSKNTVTSVYVIFLKWPYYNELRIRDLARYMKNSSRTELLSHNGTYISLKNQISPKGSLVLYLDNAAFSVSVHAGVVKISGDKTLFY